MGTVTWTETPQMTAVSGCTVAAANFDHPDLDVADLYEGWTFDEFAGNYTGVLGSCDMTPTNVTRETGRRNSGMTLVGTGHAVSPPDNYTRTSGGFSLWIKIADGVTSDQPLFSFSNTTQNIDVVCELEYAAGIFTPTIFYHRDSTVTTNKVVGTTELVAGTWYHIAASSTDTAWTMFINGVEETLSVAAGSNTGQWIGDILGTTVFVIGAERDGVSYVHYFTGQIDEVYCFLDAIDQTQATALYNGGIGIYYDSGRATQLPFSHADIPSANCICALDLDETTGNYLDKIGSADGTPTNVTRVSGKENGCASFAGDGHIDLPTNAFSDTFGSINIWMKLDSGRNYDPVLSFFAAGKRATLELYGADADSVKARVNQWIDDTTDVYNIVVGNDNISHDTWHMFTLTSNGSAWQLYVDASLQSLSVFVGANTGDWFGDMSAGGATVSLGVRFFSSAYDRYLGGDLDELTIWDTELDQDAVTALHNAGAGRFHFDNTAIVSIHDAGVAYADAGVAPAACFDFSTSVKTASANHNISGVDVFEAASTDAAVSYASDASWVAHLTREASGLRYLWRRLQFTSTDREAASISEVSTDTTILDNPIGAPANPTAAAYAAVASTKYALDWAEPGDADFSHCEIKRTTDGETMEYPQYNGNGAGITWVASPTGDLWFSENNFATCEYDGNYVAPFSHFIDEGSADGATYWVRAVDNAGNASQWVSLSLYVGGADYPDASNVTEDDTTNGTAGTLTLPAENLVYVGTQYGGGGTEFTGTYDPDFPDASNVTEDDTTDGIAGTFAVPAESNVIDGVFYGSGNEFEGSLTVTFPDVPTLAIGSSSTKDSATVTVSGSTAGVTNTLYYAVPDATEWTEAGSRVGDGDITFAPSSSFIFVYIVSSSPSAAVVTDVEKYKFQGDCEEANNNYAVAREYMLQTAVYWPPDTTLDEFGKAVPSDPCEINCRWSHEETVLISKDGTRVTSQTKVLVDRDLAEGGILWLGTIAALTSATPKENNGAYEILRFEKIPYLDAQTFVRKVFL